MAGNHGRRGKMQKDCHRAPRLVKKNQGTHGEAIGLIVSQWRARTGQGVAPGRSGYAMLINRKQMVLRLMTCEEQRNPQSQGTSNRASNEATRGSSIRLQDNRFD